MKESVEAFLTVVLAAWKKIAMCCDLFPLTARSAVSLDSKVRKSLEVRSPFFSFLPLVNWRVNLYALNFLSWLGVDLITLSFTLSCQNARFCSQFNEKYVALMPRTF